MAQGLIEGGLRSRIQPLVRVFVLDQARGCTEGSEIEKVLAFFPESSPRDVVLSTVGFVSALLSFTDVFVPAPTADDSKTIQTANFTWVAVRVEPHSTVWMCAALRRDWRPCGLPCDPPAIVAWLRQVYATFRLLHRPAPLLARTGRGGHATCCAALQALLNRFAVELLERPPPDTAPRKGVSFGVSPALHAPSARRTFAEMWHPLGRSAGVPFLQMRHNTSLQVGALIAALLALPDVPTVGAVALHEGYVLASTVGPEDTGALYRLAAGPAAALLKGGGPALASGLVPRRAGGVEGDRSGMPSLLRRFMAWSVPSAAAEATPDVDLTDTPLESALPSRNPTAHSGEHGGHGSGLAFRRASLTLGNTADGTQGGVTEPDTPTLFRLAGQQRHDDARANGRPPAPRRPLAEAWCSLEHPLRALSSACWEPWGGSCVAGVSTGREAVVRTHAGPQVPPWGGLRSAFGSAGEDAVTSRDVSFRDRGNQSCDLGESLAARRLLLPLHVWLKHPARGARRGGDAGTARGGERQTQSWTGAASEAGEGEAAQGHVAGLRQDLRRASLVPVRCGRSLVILLLVEGHVLLGAEDVAAIQAESERYADAVDAALAGEVPGHDHWHVPGYRYHHHDPSQGIRQATPWHRVRDVPLAAARHLQRVAASAREAKRGQGGGSVAVFATGPGGRPWASCCLGLAGEETRVCLTAAPEPDRVDGLAWSVQRLKRDALAFVPGAPGT
ncbi:unnamed protein product [Pedinophyceae sp. YPF-701]|nr:unnamed protein product [Pedinophyceae sp. YPF-701]